ncbi:MAG: response regulator [Planctomycetota bacterium]|jgi:putative two-component system response regulator|nr:response regulator [Planctomycetota bacterium]
MTAGKQRVFLVDDNITNLSVGKNALSGNYEVYTVNSGEKMFRLLERVRPDIVLLDVEMPGMNGYEVIRALKGSERTADIPVIFLTVKTDPGSEVEGLSLGAVDYIAKPFSPILLLARIELHLLVQTQRNKLQNFADHLQEMVTAKTKSVLELQNTLFDLLAEVVEYRDNVTGHHVDRTRRYLQIMLEGMRGGRIYREEISGWDTQLITISSQLHDVGKIAICDSILKKPGRLTPDEFEVIKKHTVYGGQIIGRVEMNMTDSAFIRHAKRMAISHHEKWAGGGYPQGLAGEDIPLEGRIMSLVDVYDALISKRPYKEPFTHGKAMEIIRGDRGTSFDPWLTDLFLKLSDKIEEAPRCE